MFALLQHSVFLSRPGSSGSSKDVWAPDAASAERAVREWLATAPPNYHDYEVTGSYTVGVCQLFSDEAVAALAAAMKPPAPEPTPEPEQALPEDEFVFDRN